MWYDFKYMNIQNKYNTLWAWWIYTTIAYVLLTLMFNFPDPDQYMEGTPLGYLFGFIGLFVPYGVISVALMMSWVSFLAFFPIMYFMEKSLRAQKYTTTQRILINLLALLLITIVVDFIRMTPFFSWAIFFSGGVLDLGF